MCIESYLHLHRECQDREIRVYKHLCSLTEELSRRGEVIIGKFWSRLSNIPLLLKESLPMNSNLKDLETYSKEINRSRDGSIQGSVKYKQYR